MNYFHIKALKQVHFYFIQPDAVSGNNVFIQDTQIRQMANRTFSILPLELFNLLFCFRKVYTKRDCIFSGQIFCFAQGLRRAGIS